MKQVMEREHLYVYEYENVWVCECVNVQFDAIVSRWFLV